MSQSPKNNLNTVDAVVDDVIAPCSLPPLFLAPSPPPSPTTFVFASQNMPLEHEQQDCEDKPNTDGEQPF